MGSPSPTPSTQSHERVSQAAGAGRDSRKRGSCDPGHQWKAGWRASSAGWLPRAARRGRVGSRAARHHRSAQAYLGDAARGDRTRLEQSFGDPVELPGGREDLAPLGRHPCDRKRTAGPRVVEDAANTSAQPLAGPTPAEVLGTQGQRRAGRRGTAREFGVSRFARTRAVTRSRHPARMGTTTSARSTALSNTRGAIGSDSSGRGWPLDRGPGGAHGRPRRLGSRGRTGDAVVGHNGCASWSGVDEGA